MGDIPVGPSIMVKKVFGFQEASHTMGVQIRFSFPLLVRDTHTLGHRIVVRMDTIGRQVLSIISLGL